MTIYTHKTPIVNPQYFNHYFSGISFDTKSHTYTLRGKNLLSATSLLSKLEPEVNWNQIAKDKAYKEGADPVQILRAWQEKSELAMRKGSLVHQFIESSLKDSTRAPTPHNDFPEMKSFLSFWLSQEYLIPVKIEWTIGDYHLGIGGTIDCLFYSNKSNKYHIFDWKTGDKFTVNNPWQNLSRPFSDLEASHLIKYSLQLSVYRLILKRNTSLLLGDSYIVKLNSDGYQEYKTFDYSDRLEQWILNFMSD